MSFPLIKDLEQRLIAVEGGAGGGGGSLTWRGISGSAPVEVEENFTEVAVFEAGLDNALYTYIKIPSMYNGNATIQMKLSFYLAGITGNYEMRVTTDLIKTDTAITVSAGTNVSNSGPIVSTVTNQIKQITFQLSLDGMVGAGLIQPNDFLRVKLERVTGTSTLDVKFIKSSTEVNY